MRKILCTAALLLTSCIYCDLADIKRECHFMIYEELTARYKSNSKEFWLSAGRVQALSHIICMIEIDQQENEK